MYLVLSDHKAKDTYTIPITYQYRYPFIPHTYLCHTYFALNHPHTCHVPVTTNTRHKRNKRTRYLRRTLVLSYTYQQCTFIVPTLRLCHANTFHVPARYLGTPVYHTSIIPLSYLLRTCYVPLQCQYLPRTHNVPNWYSAMWIPEHIHHTNFIPSASHCMPHTYLFRT